MLFDYVERELQTLRCAPDAGAELPFDFWGGWVGYFGCGAMHALTLWSSHHAPPRYELRSECLPASAPRRHASSTSDAVLFFADRLVAVDHASGDAYVLALVGVGEEGSEAEAWLADTAGRVEAVARAPRQPRVPLPSASPAPVWEGPAADAPPGSFSLRRGREEYGADVRACLEAIRSGETYEVCLTTQLSRQAGERLQPRELYRLLREGNPAPYAAWLCSGGGDGGGEGGPLHLCCSSPERLLRLDREGVLEAKPIKGTAPRVPPLGCAADLASAAALQASVKERAENLMIVDLLRHDLSHVSLPGSVHVPALCAIESYAAVHQLVSTIRSRLRPGLGAVPALRACFPAGSMTGAPKLRTCAIIDGLEPGPRGVYSGSLGFLSAGGAADLNVVIRTALLHDGLLSVGAGGAVTALSDPEEEYAEMRLKARALLQAIGRAEAAADAPP